MLPNGSGCRCHYIRHHLDWHWKGFHASVFAGRAWREAPQLFSPVGKMLRQQNMQSSLILPGSPLIDLVILDSRTRLRRSLDANPRHGKAWRICVYKNIQMETVLPGQSRHTVFHNMPLLHIKGLMPLLEMPFLLPKILGLKLGLRDIESRQ